MKHNPNWSQAYVANGIYSGCLQVKEEKLLPRITVADDILKMIDN